MLAPTYKYLSYNGSKEANVALGNADKNARLEKLMSIDKYANDSIKLIAGRVTELLIPAVIAPSQRCRNDNRFSLVTILCPT